MDNSSTVKTYNTRQREAILRCLEENRERHITADGLVAELKAAGAPVGRTTVYRQLDRLVAENVVRRFTLEDGEGACFQLADAADGCAAHFHLKCLRCGRLIHLECESLAAVCAHIGQEHRFHVDLSRTVLYGICEECERNEHHEK